MDRASVTAHYCRGAGSGPLLEVATVERGKAMTRRESGPMDIGTAAGIALILFTCYSAWLTSIIFCATNGHRPLMIAGATFFPVGIVHGVGIWFGGRRIPCAW